MNLDLNQTDEKINRERKILFPVREAYHLNLRLPSLYATGTDSWVYTDDRRRMNCEGHKEN